MTPDEALQAVNAELVRQGHPMVFLTDDMKQRAFNSLREYVHTTGRPLEVAIADIVRFQLQDEELRSQT